MLGWADPAHIHSTSQAGALFRSLVEETDLCHGNLCEGNKRRFCLLRRCVCAPAFCPIPLARSFIKPDDGLLWFGDGSRSKRETDGLHTKEGQEVKCPLCFLSRT